MRELGGERGHVDLAARARKIADVVGKTLHVGEDAIDRLRVVGEVVLEDLDVAGDVLVRDADVVVRVNRAVERFVGDEGDVLDLGEAVDEVGDAVVSPRRGFVLAAAGKGVPIPGEERHSCQEREVGGLYR
jgi:hypothetical protein